MRGEVVVSMVALPMVVVEMEVVGSVYERWVREVTHLWQRG